MNKSKVFLILIAFLTALKCYGDWQQNIVAAIIVGESASEGHLGMQEIASVISNRAIDSGKTPYQVATKRKQFSAYNRVTVSESMTASEFVAKMQKDKNWSIAVQLVKSIYDGTIEDNTNAATHYHTINSRPYWVSSMVITKRSEKHIFYREK